MSIENYIKGERHGIKAHHLEKEAMRDPFLQDAIDGYDWEDDNKADFHLKKLESRIRKQTRKSIHPLTWVGIIIGALIIIGLSIFFFLFENGNKTIIPDATTLGGKHSIDSVTINSIKDSLIALQLVQATTRNPSISDNTQEVKKESTNPQENLAVTKEKKPVWKNARDKFDDYQMTDQDLQTDEVNDYNYNNTLSNSEIQKLLSEYTIDQPVTPQISQTPKPSVGERAYNDYIKKNRQPLTEDVNEIHGKVILLFKVDQNGRPIDISILRPLTQEAEQEALRLLRNGPNWTTGDRTARLEVDF